MHGIAAGDRGPASAAGPAVKIAPRLEPVTLLEGLRANRLAVSLPPLVGRLEQSSARRLEELQAILLKNAR
ncbi:MAG: hypothetical protein QM756_39155 [Polyangiaceae bacterium]